MSSENKLHITLKRSPITSNKRQKATLKALGLHRLNQTVERVDTPTIRGMIRKVDYLVVVEEAKS